ncbi:MAG: hypothetical protein ACOY5B_14315 [Spirochaetota bacterium]
MSDLKRLVIPMSSAEEAALRSEARSHLAFFAVFGAPFAVAAVVVIWPFENIESFRWMLFGVLMTAFAGFFWLYLAQATKVWRSLADGRSVMFTGSVSRKHVEATDTGYAHQIYIGDRRFTIDESLFDQLKIGDRIAVREWLKSGEYLDHTTDIRRIAELEARALNN